MNSDFEPAAYNNRFSGRQFLKTTGAATATTILALHGTHQLSLAGLIFHRLAITGRAQPMPVPGQQGQSMLTVDIEYDLENPDSTPHDVTIGLYDVSGTQAVLVASKTALTVTAGSRVKGTKQIAIPYATFNNPPGVPPQGRAMEIRLIAHGKTQASRPFTWK